MREAAHVLLEGAPASLDRDGIARDIEANVAGVREIHHMHVWSIDGEKNMATLHACLTEGTDAHQAVTAHQVAACGDRHGIEHADRRARIRRCADRQRTRTSALASSGNIMAGRLKGKIAVVTAAGQGIGRAIAEAFVAEGATVHASDVSRDKLDGSGARQEGKLDVLSTKAVEAYAAKVGPVDILVNVAGYVHHGTVLTTSEKDWDFSFDLNVKSMHRTIRAFLPGMLERAKESGKTSSIVNIASGASSVRGIPNRYAYGASKAAVIGLTKAVAADFIRDGIRCNAVAPGTFRRRPGRTASRRSARNGAARKRRSKCSCSASRWAASPTPPRSRRSSSISPPTRRPSPPAR